MEEEDIDCTRKTSSVLLLSNNSSGNESISENYYDTNNYKQESKRNISNERVNIRQSSIAKNNSRTQFCRKIYCGPEWRRISKKSIIISFFLFFGGLAIFLSGLVIYFKSRESKGSEFLILGSIMLLPGAYSMSVIFGILQGWQGYHPDLIGESADSDEAIV